MGAARQALRHHIERHRASGAVGQIEGEGERAGEAHVAREEVVAVGAGVGPVVERADARSGRDRDGGGERGLRGRGAGGSVARGHTQASPRLLAQPVDGVGGVAARRRPAVEAQRVASLFQRHLVRRQAGATVQVNIREVGQGQASGRDLGAPHAVDARLAYAQRSAPRVRARVARGRCCGRVAGGGGGGARRCQQGKGDGQNDGRKAAIHGVQQSIQSPPRHREQPSFACSVSRCLCGSPFHRAQFGEGIVALLRSWRNLSLTSCILLSCKQ